MSSYLIRAVFLVVFSFLNIVGIPFSSAAVQAQSTIPEGIIVVTLSPDQMRAAVGGTYGLLKIVDIQTGIPLRTFSGLTGTIISIAWSPDGSRLAIAHTADETWRVYDAVNGTLVHSRALTGVKQVDWSPNTHLAVSRFLDTFSDIYLFDANFVEQCHTSSPGFVFQMDWHPSVPVLAAAIGEGILIVDADQDCRSQFTSFTGERGMEATAISFSPNGDYLAVGRRLGKVEIRNASNFQILTGFERPAQTIRAFAWSANQQFLAVTGDFNPSGIEIIRLFPFAVVSSYPIEQSSFLTTTGIAFSQGDSRLIYGDYLNLISASTSFMTTPTPTPTATPLPTGTLTVGVTLGSRSVSGIIFNVVLAQPGVVRRDLLLTADAAGRLTLPAVPYGTYTL